MPNKTTLFEFSDSTIALSHNVRRTEIKNCLNTIINWYRYRVDANYPITYQYSVSEKDYDGRKIILQ